MSTYMDNQKGYVLDRTHISRLVYIYIYVEETNSVFWYECEASRLVPNQNVNISRNITIKNAEQEKPKKSPCWICLLYTSPSPRDRSLSRMPSSA